MRTCKHGHQLTAENIRFDKTNGYRGCRLCRNEQARLCMEKRRLKLRAKGLSSNGKPLTDEWKLKLGVAPAWARVSTMEPDAR